jgi:hypothetical protein
MSASEGASGDEPQASVVNKVLRTPSQRVLKPWLIVRLEEALMMITRYESIWTDLASLAVAGASLAFLAFVLTSVLAR